MEIGDEGHEIHVAATFSYAVDGALDVIRAGEDCGLGVGDRERGVVVGVDA